MQRFFFIYIVTTKSTTNVLPISEDVFRDHESPCLVTDKENILQQQDTELNSMIGNMSPKPTTSTETVAVSSPTVELVSEEKSTAEKVIEIDEKKDQVLKKNTIASVDISTELIDLNSKNNAITEIIQAKEVSPKKTIPKFTPLVSYKIWFLFLSLQFLLSSIDNDW